EYIKIMKQHNLICFIELKGDFSDEEIESMFGFVREEYDISKCIMQSFEFDNLLKAKEVVPDLPLMLTYGVGDGDYEKCFEYGISIDTDYNALTQKMVDDFHSRGLLVAAWTANTRFALNYCRAMGVDLIESDYFMK
ncbi:MAG: glycerophosphodiester phosphodiesterase, partial [Clostridiales bacterium]|nr:glycerophosphodiester phosphodiesterase [Clostridiales bacterium]